MHHRGFIFWGVGLVTAGSVALAVQQGLIDRSLVSDAWRFWPLILVAIGFSMVVARTQFAILGSLVAGLTAGMVAGALIAGGPLILPCAGDEPTHLATQSGQFSSPSSVTLDFSCGTLDVGTTNSSGWTVQFGQGSGHPPVINSASDRLEVATPSIANFVQLPRQLWFVGLPHETRYTELRIEADAADVAVSLVDAHFDALIGTINAGSIQINVHGSTVAGLDIAVNAGSANLNVDGTNDLSGRLHVDAGSIQVCTTGDVALRITLTDTNAFGDNLGDSGLEQSGDAWSTAGWESAAHLVEITVSGNAGSFNLNPEGGCA